MVAGSAAGAAYTESCWYSVEMQVIRCWISVCVCAFMHFVILVQRTVIMLHVMSSVLLSEFEQLCWSCSNVNINCRILCKLCYITYSSNNSCWGLSDKIIHNCWYCSRFSRNCNGYMLGQLSSITSYELQSIYCNVFRFYCLSLVLLDWTELL